MSTNVNRKNHTSFDVHTCTHTYSLWFSLLQEGGSGKQLFNKLKDHKICSSKDNQPLHSMVTIAKHWFLKIKMILSLLHRLDTMLNCLNKLQQFNYLHCLSINFKRREISLYLHTTTGTGTHSNKPKTSLLSYAAALCHRFNLSLKILPLTFKKAISMQ